MNSLGPDCTKRPCASECQSLHSRMMCCELLQLVARARGNSSAAKGESDEAWNRWNEHQKAHCPGWVEFKPEDDEAAVGDGCSGLS